MAIPSSIMQRYEAWLNDPGIDAETKRELEALRGQESEIEDRFYRDLEFGTGGLRGVIGAGTNRMNRYTVGLATQGLAQYLLANAAEAGDGKAPSCVIAHDSRRFSPEFALETALVLAANGARDPRETLGPYVETLLELRGRARAARDYPTSDWIRDRLVAAGIEVRDTPDGVIWEPREP